VDRTQQLIQEVGTHYARMHSAETDVVRFARSLVFTLRDAGREAAATELERLLFHVDALEGELFKMVQTDPAAFLAAVFSQEPPQ
jgi:hypothetical protein